VIGTTVVPMPIPVSASASASGAYGGLGLRVSSRPALNIRQPTTIDQRGPAALVQRPASTEAAIIKVVMGRNTSAIW